MSARPFGPIPGETVLRRIYVAGGASIRQTALTLGYSKEAISRALREYGIDRRPPVPRSKLRHYSIRELKSGVRDLGLRGYARALGVSAPTLLHHLNEREKK
jgi:hypothetical protein